MIPQSDLRDDPLRPLDDPSLETVHTVLVVDDESQIRRSLERALHKEPY